MYVDPQKARQERERQERERQARIKAEKERQAKIKAEKERQAKLKAERDRKAKLKAEEERQAKLKAEQKDTDKKPTQAKKPDPKLEAKKPTEQKQDNKKSQGDKKPDEKSQTEITWSKPGESSPIYGPSAPIYGSISPTYGRNSVPIAKGSEPKKPEVPLDRKARTWSGEKVEPQAEPKPYVPRDLSSFKQEIAEGRAQKEQKKQEQLKNTLKQEPGVSEILKQPSFLNSALTFGTELSQPGLGTTFLSGSKGLSQSEKAKQPEAEKKSKPSGGGFFGDVFNMGKSVLNGAKAFGEQAVEGAKTLGKDAVAGAKAVGNWVDKNKDLVKDIGHTALDIAGFIPVIGTAADLVNAGWYAAEGRYAEAAASAMSAVPGVGDAFAAGKMGVKLATTAPKVMKTITTASHLAPMAPALFQAGSAALEGDFSQAALTAGSAFVPALGGKAGQRLLSKADDSGSKMQTIAGNILSRGSGAAPNAIGATQVHQAYEAHQNGEGSAWEVAKSVMYAGAPFAFGRGGKKPPTNEPQTTGKNHQPETRDTSPREETLTGKGAQQPKEAQQQKQSHDPAGTTVEPKGKVKRGESSPDLTPEREQMRKEGEALQKALPKSAKVPVEVNPKLEGNTVQVHYEVDGKGRVTDVHIQAGPQATPRDIELHARTVKSMKRYSGMSFHAQKLKDRFEGWVSKNGVPPVGSKAWEAKLEIQKLPDIIGDRAAKLTSGDLTPQQREKLEKEVTHLEHQLDGYKKDFKAMNQDPGKGFVAAESYKERQIEKQRKEKTLDAKRTEKDKQEAEKIASSLIQKGATHDPKLAKRAAELEVSAKKDIEEKVRSFEGTKKQKKDYQTELEGRAPIESLVKARDEIHPGAKMHPEDAPAVTKIDPKTDYPFGFYSRPGFDKFSKTVHDTFHSSFDERLAPKLDKLDSKALKALGLEGDGASIVAAIKKEMQFTIEGSSVHGRSYDRVKHTGHTGKPFDLGSRDKLSDYDIAIVSPTLYKVSQANFIPLAEGGKAKTPRTDPLKDKHLDILGLDKESRENIQRAVTDSTKLGHTANFKIYSGEGRDPNTLNLPLPNNGNGSDDNK